jgi:hypothetical protein
MGLWLLLVETVCRDQGREEEFNRWYDETHIPDVLKGGSEFRACRRYKSIAGAGGQEVYLAAIEIETEDITQALDNLRKTGERIRAEGRWTDLVEVISRRLYRLDREL